MRGSSFCAQRNCNEKDARLRLRAISDDLKFTCDCHHLDSPHYLCGAVFQYFSSTYRLHLVSRVTPSSLNNIHSRTILIYISHLRKRKVAQVKNIRLLGKEERNSLIIRIFYLKFCRKSSEATFSFIENNFTYLCLVKL